MTNNHLLNNRFFTPWSSHIGTYHHNFVGWDYPKPLPLSPIQSRDLGNGAGVMGLHRWIGLQFSSDWTLLLLVFFFGFDSVAVCEIFWFLLLPLQDFRSPHARPEDKNSAPSAHPHLRELYEGSSRQLHTQMERLSKAQIGRLGRRVSIHEMAGICLCKYASCLSFHDF